MEYKHEKIIVAKGKLAVLKKAISELSKEDKSFKKAMKLLPKIQKLPTHYYVYVPFESRLKVKEKFEQIHYDKYGYID